MLQKLKLWKFYRYQTYFLCIKGHFIKIKSVLSMFWNFDSQIETQQGKHKMYNLDVSIKIAQNLENLWKRGGSSKLEGQTGHS